MALGFFLRKNYSDLFKYLSKIQLTNLGEPASEYLLQSSIISFISISLGV
jgi:hypothetical protein